MTLGVVTATRGESIHLRETVESVHRLGVDVEHVLVCPRVVAAKLRERFSRLRVIEEQAGTGLYGALNQARGVMAAVDHLTWINDDDVLYGEGARAALDHLARYPEVAVVYGRVGLIDGNGKGLGELPVAKRADDMLALLSAGIMPLAQPGTLLRRSVLDALGWFDVTYRLAGDLDLFVRAACSGLKFAYVAERMADFRLHGGQLSKDEGGAERERRRALSSLPLGRAALSACVWRFRWGNRWVYLDRLRRHGPRRMASLYRHV